jgi:hypothetical protein
MALTSAPLSRAGHGLRQSAHGLARLAIRAEKSLESRRTLPVRDLGDGGPGRSSWRLHASILRPGCGARQIARWRRSCPARGRGGRCERADRGTAPAVGGASAAPRPGCPILVSARFVERRSSSVRRAAATWLDAAPRPPSSRARSSKVRREGPRPREARETMSAGQVSDNPDASHTTADSRDASHTAADSPDAPRRRQRPPAARRRIARVSPLKMKTCAGISTNQ